MNTKAMLQLPPGSAGLFLEEAARHQQAIDVTNRLYSQWGYTIVQTPMVDFFDAHSHMLTAAEQSRLYRLIGRDGEVLMLRSDITIFLLKHFQSLLKGAEFPVRLAYSDSILRHEDSIDISRNEHYQSGAELIGGEIMDSDLEILLMLSEQLNALGLERPAVHIGSRRIFNQIFKEIESRSLLREIEAAILERDWKAVEPLTSDIFDAETARTIGRLFSMISDIHSPPGNSGETGSEAEKDRLKELMSLAEDPRIAQLAPGISGDISYLGELCSTVSEYFPRMQFRVDLSEIGQRHYYSGMVFQVYASGIPYGIASGGRYDDLIEEMGMSSGAVGFSIMLSALGGMNPQGNPSEPRRLSREEPEMNFRSRYEKAREMRKNGGSVCL
ncbi:ATP phosphoribosyltransferase regulatory subunit [Salinispira pacifica]|uniref:ATP phosphoribosyltransferase regulatory subunit n=1 Tax=Salinispira pacifica TaxID=1307761 RepID=V5WF82_9SPIO|nr:ATP phosphoribosyltransferase regulatory subunit [Salinispira pacifica]AHC14458.1 ATP phosphoribosyltransferase regulatory subunit [Salinispira pacifica]